MPAESAARKRQEEELPNTKRALLKEMSIGCDLTKELHLGEKSRKGLNGDFRARKEKV